VLIKISSPILQNNSQENQYFKNYYSLEKHFDRQHFLCHDVQCLQARFVVFTNELDLRHHERQVHGGTSSGDTKIQLEFKVRGRPGFASPGFENQQVPDETDFNFGLDGEAFVPDAPPAAGEGGGGAVALHPLHVQRTAQLRQQAEALRSGASDAVEAFPSLRDAVNNSGDGTGNDQNNKLRMGWNDGASLQKVGQLKKKKAGQVTDEDFPSLPSAPPRPGRGIAASRGAVSSTGRQFSAMNVSAGVGAAAPSWGSAAASTPPPSYTSTSFLAPSASTAATAVARNTNQAKNLTSDNFPTLGPAPSASSASVRGKGVSSAARGRGSTTYLAANALAKKLQNPSSQGPTYDNYFPSLGAASAPYGAPTASGRQKLQNLKPPPQQAPSLDSATDFPAPPAATSAPPTQHNSIRHASAISNVLQPPSAQSKATVENMKATLGHDHYKQLKSFTKQFVANELDPESYVDYAASLFEEGYMDSNFWDFVPSLLSSVPNATASKQAMQYMEKLRDMRIERTLNATATAANTNSTSSNVARAPSQTIAVPPSAPLVPPPAPPPGFKPAPIVRPNVVAPAAKKKQPQKNAWGGGAATVVRAKAPPGSVAVAAANATTQGGSATKYMAKQSKQEKHQQHQQDKKKKNKQSDELRQLAFG